jgi:hypothetical protein
MTARVRIVTPPEDAAQPTVEQQWIDAADITARPCKWLLPGRLPAGCLVVVEGAKSASKSTFCAGLAAALTRGRPLIGRKKLPLGDVLWSCGEEGPDQYAVPRLQLAGADMRRVHFTAIDDHGEHRRLWLPSCVPTLRSAIEHWGVRLVILDPLSSHVPMELSLHHDQAIHHILDPLGHLAFATGCTVIVTRNLTKDRGADRADRGLGGSGISGVARAVLLIERPDPATARRLLRVVVKNVGVEAAPVEYHLEGPGDHARLTRVRELAAADDDDDTHGDEPDERDALDNATQLLRALLVDGAVDAQAVAREAEAALIAPRTLRRAKARLKVWHRRVPGSQPARWEWCPPKGGW